MRACAGLDSGMDHLTPDERSANMKRIRRADTKPEWAVRRLLHGLGYRYRLQWKAAPGRPDIAFPGRRKIIFVHGCFWHRHEGCRRATTPSTRADFWTAKFRRNIERDARNLERAAEEGWDALVIWECELRPVDSLEGRLTTFLGAPPPDGQPRKSEGASEVTLKSPLSLASPEPASRGLNARGASETRLAIVDKAKSKLGPR